MFIHAYTTNLIYYYQHYTYAYTHTRTLIHLTTHTYMPQIMHVMCCVIKIPKILYHQKEEGKKTTV